MLTKWEIFSWKISDFTPLTGKDGTIYVKHYQSWSQILHKRILSVENVGVV